MADEKLARYTYEFSHEFDAGPSGPARSYWNLKGPGMSQSTSVCLHHRRDANGPLAMQSLCYALDNAFEAGEAQRAKDISQLLGGLGRVGRS
ncbi:hypothetical protein [Sphingomonas phage Carli]|nr:hypothetical protein [Sphingomonas phage Carli]